MSELRPCPLCTGKGELVEAATLMIEILGFIRDTHALRCTPSGNFYIVDLNKEAVDELYNKIQAALEESDDANR